MRHFISLRAWGRAEIEATLDRASELSRLWKSRAMPRALSRERVALWFYGEGFRNRLAFELGARDTRWTLPIWQSFVPAAQARLK